MFYFSDPAREELEIESNGRDDYNREAYGDTAIPDDWDDDPEYYGSEETVIIENHLKHLETPLKQFDSDEDCPF